MPKTIRPKEIIRQRNRRLIAVTALVFIASFIYLGYWWMSNRNWVSTDDAFVSGHLITVKAQTDGTIVEILAENTQQVKPGQLLVRLNGAKAKLQLQQAQAELGERVRRIVSLKTQIEMLNQRVKARQAEMNLVRHDLQRFQTAAKEGAISAQKVQNAQDRLQRLAAEIATINAEKSSIEARILNGDIANHPSIEKAKNRLRLAYLAYQRRHIIAPVGGVVAKRRAQVGDQVKTGSPLLVIVPMNDLWVEANLLETKIARVRPGQTAEIRVDAYRDGFVYHGTVEGINPGTGSAFALLPTDNASGNFIHIAERVPVRIGLDAEELKRHPLQPGLSTLTRIKVDEPGEALLTSTTTTNHDAYHTTIYENEMDGVESLIDRIVAMNIKP